MNYSSSFSNLNENISKQNINIQKKIFYTLLIIITLLKVIFISFTMVIDDEAYYYIYSKHLSAGYIDHGPVIAYMIKFFTLVFGDNSFGIRISGVILTLIAVLVIFKVLEKEGKGLGYITGNIINTTILFFAGSIIITPDTPMAFFFTLTILFYYLAYFRDKKYFYLAGILLGFSMLSKISVAFPAIGIFIFPFLIKEKRNNIKYKEFWISFIIAFIIFLPFIIWNINNNFAFVKYQFKHISRIGDIGDFFDLWGAQAGFLFPILFVFSFYLPFKYIFEFYIKKINLNKDKIYFSLISIVPFIYFIYNSFKHRYEANWPVVCFMGGLFLFSIYVKEKFNKMKIYYYIQIFTSFVLILIIILHVFFPFLPLKGNNDITNRYYYYNFLYDLKKYYNENKEIKKYRIVSNNYQLPSMINLYVKPEKEAICLSIRGYHETLYSFIYNDNLLKGKDYLFIWYGTKFPKSYSKYFKSVKKVKTFYSYRKKKKIKTFILWFAENYKGKDLEY